MVNRQELHWRSDTADKEFALTSRGQQHAFEKSRTEGWSTTMQSASVRLMVPIKNLGEEWFSVYVWGHDEDTLLRLNTQLRTVPEKTLGEGFSLEHRIVPNISFSFQLMVPFFSIVDRGDLAQGFTEQNGFYQSSPVSPSRAIVHRCLRHWPWNTWDSSGTPHPRAGEAQRAGVYSEMLCSNHRKGIKESWGEAPSLLSCIWIPVLTSWCAHPT